jgi:hypothetical protein
LLAILVEVGDPKNVPVDMILTGNTWRWEHIILQKKDAPTTECNHQVTSRRKKTGDCHKTQCIIIPMFASKHILIIL